MPSSRAIAFLAAVASALCPGAAHPAGGPIQDNSFLIEEAYNQEPGVIQHIGTFTRASGSGAWASTFTEEWPVGGQEHQASATFTYARAQPGGASGLGDLALNWRWQALGSGETALALAPRLTLLLPSGDAARGLGSGGAGLQVNLPLSTVLGAGLVAHSNLGGTWVPSARPAAGGRGALAGLAVGQSLVWLAHPGLNLLAEVLYTTTAISGPAGRERTESLTFNPGLRAALDLGGLQIVPGLGLPLGLGPSRGERAVFLYLSLEHPI